METGDLANQEMGGAICLLPESLRVLLLHVERSPERKRRAIQDAEPNNLLQRTRNKPRALFLPLALKGGKNDV